LHGCVPIRMLRAGVLDGVGRAGVGVTKPNGEYIFTSCLACLSRFLWDDPGVLPGVLVPSVRRLWPRVGNFTFWQT